jgi:hypothetical protein
MELESVLGHANGLKELILNSVIFEDVSARRAGPVSHEPRVVLDSLKLDFPVLVDFPERVAKHALDAMLSTFSTPDITHLRSLDVSMYTPLLPLLKANARTVQKVRCYYPHYADDCTSVQPRCPFSDPDESVAQRSLLIRTFWKTTLLCAIST